MATNLERLEKICGNNFTVFQKQAIYQWAKDTYTESGEYG